MPEVANHRHARLVLSASDTGPTLTAQVPLELSEDDFLKVSAEAYRLIAGLTGCNCNSGRISFVVENIYEHVINVDLGASEAGAVFAR